MSSDLTSFSENFSRLTGHPPMRWQRRLFEQFVDGDIPSALDLPTGLGKTSVIAIWLIARALASQDVLKAIPRRLIYVVDRRAVVDQATEEAEKLRNALESDAKHLKAALGLNEVRLPISTLRGAHIDNREWLEDPATPAIIVGTVDMIGSRLLFEGYGVSRKMRPYHAGLLGADTLVVLDEAHLVPPFQHLLRAIKKGDGLLPGGRDRLDIVPHFHVLLLSATQLAAAPDNADRKPFCLEPEDRENDRLVQRRWRAQKTLRLEAPAENWDIALAQRAWALATADGKPSRVVAFCTRRDKKDGGSGGPSVAGVQAEIEKLAKRDNREFACELLVGGRRVKERQDAAAQLKCLGFAGGGLERPPGPTVPTFLLATSAGEVGVDFDADHMLCDLAPWERMVQRLGRVNRRGGEGRTAMVAVFDTSDVKTKDEDRKTRLVNTLALLKRIGEGGSLSSEGLAKLRSEAGATAIEEASTPEPLRPALTRALVDAWSMTSLEQHTGRPAIAPWLRGWTDEDVQTTVIWRTHLPVREGVADWPRTLAERKEIEAFFEAAPPHESEKLETETWRVADWLQERAKELLNRGASGSQEQVGAVAEAPDARPLHGDDVVVLVLLPDGSFARCFTLKELAELRKGGAKNDFRDLAEKLLIVDARFGGLRDGMLDAKGDDISPTADADDGWSKDAEFRVRRVTSETDGNKENDWHYEDDFVLKRDAEGQPYEWLLVEHYKSTAQSENARSVSRPQELAGHQSCAEQKARLIAERIGLSGHAAEALAVAAFLHDEGKKASRWQRAFKAERDAKKCGFSGPLAKTRGPIEQAILDGYRHEFGSLPIAEAHARFQALPQEWRDLVLHLIAAHHGQARPVIETRGCEDAPPSALAATVFTHLG
jgi:CRISPR-associated endonuclease/helicase Cas3